MNTAIVLAGSVLVVVLVLALAREVRLRRALQQVLARLMNYLKGRHDEKDNSNRGSVHARRSGKRVRNVTR